MFSLVNEPSWEALHALFCAPKLILRAVTTRGPQQSHLLSQEIGRRIALFWDRKLLDLWKEATPGPGMSHRPKTRRMTREEADDLTEALPASVINGVRGLVEEGAFAKAAKHLVSHGVADGSDPATILCLQELHPDGPQVDLGPERTFLWH